MLGCREHWFIIRFRGVIYAWVSGTFSSTHSLALSFWFLVLATSLVVWLSIFLVFYIPSQIFWRTFNVLSFLCGPSPILLCGSSWVLDLFADKGLIAPLCPSFGLFLDHLLYYVYNHGLYNCFIKYLEICTSRYFIPLNV